VIIWTGDLDSLTRAAIETKVFIALCPATSKTWLICGYICLTFRASEDKALELTDWDPS